MRKFLWIVLLSLPIGCGRYFAGPIRPAPEAQQGSATVVKDDGSVVSIRERLEISLRPMLDEEINRQFASQSQDKALSTNPYTYGNWRPSGEKWTPSKYTVFLLKVKNYEYPKVRVDPSKAEVVAEAVRRRYPSLSMLEIVEFYYTYVLGGYAGNDYQRFEERKDILQQTLYTDDMVFSGQEKEGYIVFPRLDHDVKTFSVHLRGVVLRFDYRDEPVETMDLVFRFWRDVHKGYHPPSSL
jgi:hypothetical protein